MGDYMVIIILLLLFYISSDLNEWGISTRKEQICYLFGKKNKNVSFISKIHF